jgi:hypothetical protein
MNTGSLHLTSHQGEGSPDLRGSLTEVRDSITMSFSLPRRCRCSHLTNPINNAAGKPQQQQASSSTPGHDHLRFFLYNHSLTEKQKHLGPMGSKYRMPVENAGEHWLKQNLLLQQIADNLAIPTCL